MNSKMVFNFVILVFLVVFCVPIRSEIREKPPHIVVIVADDLGWNDVSFHGSNQIPTPNIDALAYNGIILNSHYVQPLCTPSRASFLTGKYPIHLGMQHGVLLEPEPRGLPLEEKLLPHYLKNIGYSTHAVGKWHLGYYRTEYTPTKRGFDTHYGYWNGFQDYYDHTVQATFVPKMSGYDMRRNLEVDYSARGKYSTELFTEEATRIILKHNTSVPMFMYLAHLAPHTGNMRNPFQAPDEEIAKFSHIADPERRVYAAMVSVLDRSVGQVVTALRSKGMLDNSIILFFSDNGAPTYGIHSNRGSNFPLRGQKESPWEGASRGAAAIWSPLFKTFNRVSNQLMHVSDWLPTLWKAAGRDPKELGKIDGINMWEALKKNNPSPRTDVVINIDEVAPYLAVRKGDWKYINGTTGDGKYDHWMGDPGTQAEEYDLGNVLTSPASIALSGYITEKQIKEKNTNASSPYTMKIVRKDTIISLRNEASIKCNLEPGDSKIPCDPMKAPCLFNIKEDPCEFVNLAEVRPIILSDLEDLVNKYKGSSKQSANVPYDENADPIRYNNVWTSWKDDVVSVRTIFNSFSQSAILALGIFCAILALALLIIIFAFVKKTSWYKNVIRSRSFGNRSSRRPRFSSLNKDKKNGTAREPGIASPVSVAQRIELFEEHSQSKNFESL